jgi:hypothetical protein
VPVVLEVVEQLMQLVAADCKLMYLPLVFLLLLQTLLVAVIHQRDGIFASEEGANHVNIEVQPEMGEAAILDALEDHIAGVVDEAVDPPEPADHLADQVLRLLAVRDIGAEGCPVATGRP